MASSDNVGLSLLLLTALAIDTLGDPRWMRFRDEYDTGRKKLGFFATLFTGPSSFDRPLTAKRQEMLCQSFAITALCRRIRMYLVPYCRFMHCQVKLTDRSGEPEWHGFSAT